MSAEVWTILSVGIALGGLVIGLGIFLSLTIRSLRDRMMCHFDQVDRQFDRLERWFNPTGLQFLATYECRAGVDTHVHPIVGSLRETRRQLDALADDHDALARELSQFRGEIRGRLDARVRHLATIFGEQG